MLNICLIVYYFPLLFVFIVLLNRDHTHLTMVFTHLTAVFTEGVFSAVVTLACLLWGNWVHSCVAYVYICCGTHWSCVTFMAVLVRACIFDHGAY